MKTIRYSVLTHLLAVLAASQASAITSGVKLRLAAALAAMTCWQAITATAEPLVLVRDSRAVCTIVTGRDDRISSVHTMARSTITHARPANVLAFAARDLAEHLAEMARIWNPAHEPLIVQHVDEARTATRILLGTAAIAQYGLAAEAGALPYPAYIYRVIGNDLCIFGSSSKGTANGVYGFLQDELGVRWFGPQPLFRVVPEKKTVTVGAIDRRAVPSFLGRQFHTESRVELPAYPWARRRMRMREPVDQGEPYANVSHYLHRLFPARKYAEKNPDFYAMRSGRRVDPTKNKNWNICYSNPEVAEIAAKAALAYFRARPYHHCFSLGINDGAAYCECDRCARRQPPREFRGARVASDMYFHFVNKVARRVREEFPDRAIGMIAYNDVTPPPLGPVEKNVHVVLVNDVSEYFDAAYRQQCEELVAAWQAKGITLGLYYYTGLAKLAPAYFPRLLASELKDKHDRGFTSVTSEVYPGWPWRGPMAYVHARLWWDIDRDVDALLNEYFTGLFGPAAKPMQELFELFEQIHLRPRRGGFLYEHYKLQQFRPYAAADLARMKTLLAAAHAAVPGLGVGYAGRDGKPGQRVAYMSNGLKPFLAMLEGLALADELRESAAELDSVAAMERLHIIERLNALHEQYDTLYRETIIADEYQSRRYTHDTCKPVRQQWKNRVSSVIGPALARLDRWAAGDGVDPRVRAKVAQAVAVYTSDPFRKAMLMIHAGRVELGPNRIANPGFEDTAGEHPAYPPHLEWNATAADNWACWQYVPGRGRFDVSAEAKRSGARSGLMRGIGSGCFMTLVREVKPGELYHAEAHVLNRAHTVQEKKPEVSLQIRWLDLNDRWNRGAPHYTVASQELDHWVKLESVVQIPENVATVVLMLNAQPLEPERDVFVDDVSFRRLSFPPVPGQAGAALHGERYRRALFLVHAGKATLGPNLAGNAGFETVDADGVPKGWSRTPHADVTGLRVDTVVHDPPDPRFGARSGRVAGVRDRAYYLRSVGGISPEHVYLCQADARLAGAGDAGARAYLLVRWFGRNGWIRTDDFLSPDLAEQDAWGRLETLAVPPENATRAQVFLFVENLSPGQEAWFDNLTVRRIGE